MLLEIAATFPDSLINKTILDKREGRGKMYESIICRKIVFWFFSDKKKWTRIKGKKGKDLIRYNKEGKIF